MREPLPEAFTGCVVSVFGEDKVIVATEAHPSQPIKLWYKNWKPPAGMVDPQPDQNGNLYERLLGKVRRAVQKEALQSVTFIWMQGEADAGSGWGGVYEASFYGLLEQLKQDLGIEEIHFVVGRINDFGLDPGKSTERERVREIQVKLGEENANGAWIDTDDLNRGVNPWGGYSLCDGHFPPPAYRIMGKRFARAACRLIDPGMKLDPGLFDEVFFDTADDVSSHEAIGKTVTSRSDSLVGGGKSPDFARLTDGAFGSSDHQDPSWFRIAPSEAPVELILDLGKLQQVHAIGVHTLFSPPAAAEFPESFAFESSEDGAIYRQNRGRYNTIQVTKYDRPDLVRSASPSEPLLVLTDQTKPRSWQTGVQARYIKITVKTGGQWVLIDEIIVNPAKARFL